MDAPLIITDSALWARLGEDMQLQQSILQLRSKATTFAETISRTLPQFTDHSVRHMDALWDVAEKVLTAEEIEELSVGEAFLLCCGFYLHDIGMAIAGTAEGLRKVKESSAFKGCLAKFKGSGAGSSCDAGNVECRALALAVRKMHAQEAYDLATRPIPGTDCFLLEPQSVREAWGLTAGKIANSHHWSIEEVHSHLGRQGQVPLASSGKGDLAYVACALRLIDYAHINHQRAPTLERAFRQDIDSTSLVHWLAQEHIQGPERTSAELVFRSGAPVAGVDAWWLYYQMLSGLDQEIRSVRRYLEGRPESQGRLSLTGVRGAASPEECAAYIETGGFSPVEVNIRAGSVERLLRLLGGDTLYGGNRTVVVRELLQNARDAVRLKQTLSVSEYEQTLAGLPIEIRIMTGGRPSLEVLDHGVGMSKEVIQDFLLTIASDYWSSDRFFSEHPSARDRGFKPAGRFGIGFMSVFMLGDEVEVETSRGGQSGYRVVLRGPGRRGEIRPAQLPPGGGTKVRVCLAGDNSQLFAKDLAKIVQAWAPMLDQDMKVENGRGECTPVPRQWWKRQAPTAFVQDVIDIAGNLSGSMSDDPRGTVRGWRPRWHRLHADDGELRDAPWGASWPEWAGETWRILAHPYLGVSVLCHHGMALAAIPTPGFVGLWDDANLTPDVGRQQALGFDRKTLLQRASAAVRPGVTSFLDGLAKDVFVYKHLELVELCIEYYGRDTARLSSLPWVSIVRPPGNVEVVNCAELLRRLTNTTMVRVAYGVGPWTAMKRWSSSVSNETLYIVLDESRRRSFFYTREMRKGSLSQVWEEYERCPALDLVMIVVAEAWGVQKEALAAGAGEWECESDKIFGEISRGSVATVA